MIEDFKGVQHDILTSTNNAVLVSAGAGSGKTTVMIEKIADLIINQNVPVNSLLVVTFTVLAAEEMKERLIEKLKSVLTTSPDKERILDLIEQVKTASIDTIDGFSSKTIRKYFYTLEINPNIEIISDATRDYYITRAMKKTLDDYEANTQNFEQLLDIFGGDSRNLNTLNRLIVDIYYKLINIEDYNQFLMDALNEYKTDEHCVNFLKDKILNTINYAKKLAQGGFSALDETLQKLCLNFIDQLNKFNSDDNLKALLKKLKEITCPELRGKKNCDEVKTAIKLVKDLEKKMQTEGIDESYDIKNAEIYEYLTNFLEILTAFMQNYKQIKQKNNLIDFNDLNRLMLKLLSNEKVKAELQAQYRYVFIDEYQDVNPLQDNLLAQVIGKNTKLFLVGDVKQSIYGFRGANPNSFLNRYTNYKNNNKVGQAFNMNVNYRSNPIIMQFVNDVFARIMTEADADINYGEDCMIEPKRDDINDDKVSLMLAKEVDKPLAKNLYSVKNAKLVDEQNDEAVLVLLAITNLINKPFYDAKLKCNRNIEYKDIAILSRSCEDEQARQLINFLRQHNVPLKTSTKLDVVQNEGVKLIMSILKCVVGLADDVDYLATFFALTDVTAEEVAEIKLGADSLYGGLKASSKDKITNGFNLINGMEKYSYHSTNSQLIRYILNDCALRYNLLLKPNGEAVVNDIEEFIGKLSALEDCLNLAEFIKVVESSKNQSSEVENLDEENSVTIQTIHKSKGLEYPVVILYNTAKQFNYITDNSLINFNTEFGLGVDYYNYETRTKINSVPRYVIKQTNDIKGYKEEMRLLYVALTRAKNKLIITGTYNDKIFEDNVKPNNFLNMLIGGFCPLKEGENNFKNCNIYVFDKIKTPKQQLEVESKTITKAYENFVYSNTDKFSIPLKNTVTGLNSEHSENNGFYTKEITQATVQYNADEDKALIGTHYHKALELLELNQPYKQTTNYEDVDYKKIELAHKTLAPLTKNAHMHKEAEFMMYVPYNKIVNSAVEDKVLVQGVVDLIIEKENSITIVDYKFSTKPIKVLKQRYSEQLNLYKLAVEQAFNKKVDNIYIYSINTGELG